MTTPPAITFSFFHKQTLSKNFRDFQLNLLDSIKYTYHSLSFILYFITLIDFRREVFRLLQCRFTNTDNLSKYF